MRKKPISRKDPKSRAGMGRNEDGSPRVSLSRLSKLSGYSVASVVAKRKQGYSDEEIVTQGLERQERQDRSGSPGSLGSLGSLGSVDSTKSRGPIQFPPPPNPLPPPPKINRSRAEDNGEDDPMSEAVPTDIPAETYSQAALREKIAIANKREMEELVMRGLLVQADEVAKEWARIGGRLRDEMLAIPDRISIRLDQRPYREIREILMMEIRRVLLGISEEVGEQAQSSASINPLANSVGSTQSEVRTSL